MYKRDTGVAVRVCDRLFDLQKNICQKIFDTRYITVTVKKKLSQIFENFGNPALITGFNVIGEYRALMSCFFCIQTCGGRIFCRQFLIRENMLVFSAEETPGQQPLAQLVRFVNL